MTTHAERRADLQPALDDVGQLLADTTFVVVDLETTGGSAESAITEIGAVKVRGGEVLGEFQTLVNPCAHIPAFIAVLTGITDQMVAASPRIDTVLPSFLEFARGSVLVAHNARFDVGFLQRNAAALGLPWPGFPVVDTVALARHALLRDEVPNCKLSTLAAHFHATTDPEHRALADARATVDVLHALLERVGSLGVSTLDDLQEFTRKVSPQRRAKRVWASRLPEQPGVYCFVVDHQEASPPRREVLYVGKSVNIRARVRSYFTASETRPRMEEMVRIATGVEAHPCATPLEAEVRELRLIQSHQPHYNRRSRRQDRLVWIRLTREAFPRLSVVRTLHEGDDAFLGPFTSRADADEACRAIQEAFRLRQCTVRLSRTRPTPSCALLGMHRCCGPCELGEAAAGYPALVEDARVGLGTDVRAVVAALSARTARLADQERFEEAETCTRRLSTYLAASARLQRVRSLAACPEIVAASPRADLPGAWHLHVIRHARLCGAATTRPDESPRAVARDLVRTAETVLPDPHGLPACTIEEAERVAAWLEAPGTRLLDIDGEWAWPLHSVGISPTTAPPAAPGDLVSRGSGNSGTHPHERDDSQTHHGERGVPDDQTPGA